MALSYNPIAIYSLAGNKWSAEQLEIAFLHSPMESCLIEDIDFNYRAFPSFEITCISASMYECLNVGK